MQVFKKIWKAILLIMTGKDEQAVKDGLCDYSGQGRDKYGK